MAQVGKKVYYELSTGNIILDTGEREGSVIETTQEQDFEAYVALAERVPATVGVIELAYGEYAQDFVECNGYSVDISGETPSLVFSYPDPNAPQDPPVYRKPLSVEMAEVKAENEQQNLSIIDIFETLIPLLP